MSGPPRDRDLVPEVPERRLAAHEVVAILRRASTAEVRGEVPARHDLTLRDLMEVAGEAGLDPAAVRRAAAVESSPPSGFTHTVLGAPGRMSVRARTPVPLPVGAGERAALVRAAGALLGRGGEVLEDDPDRLTWRESHGIGRTTVSLAASAAGTEVLVDADRTGHALVAWFGGAVAWAVASALLHLAALGIGLWTLGFVAAPFLLARPFWIRSGARLQDDLEHLAMELQRTVEESPATPPELAEGDGAEAPTG